MSARRLRDLALDRAGNVLARTGGIDAVLAGAGRPMAWHDTAADGAANLYDLSLHPSGVVTLLVNPHEVVPHTLRRLAAAAAADDGAARTVERVSAYPAAKRWPAESAANVSSDGSGVLVEEYAVDSRRIRLVSVTASFASPEDVTTQDRHLELLYPADAATERAIVELVGPQPAQALTRPPLSHSRRCGE